jgi:Ni,Fe-hydrogenase III large subunit
MRPMQPIATLLGAATPAADHKPWPRYEIDADTWNVIGRALGEGGGDLLGLWSNSENVYAAVRDGGFFAIVSTQPKYGAFPSLGQHHPPAIRLERAIRDLYGLQPFGAPDARPWLDHGAWGVWAPLGAKTRASRRNPAAYDFLSVAGEGLHQIAVGPVHAGIIEPGHFRFTANGEAVARLEARLGYVHKGIDGLLVDADLERAARVVARVSGDSTVAYSFAFARAVEAALDVTVPRRGQVVRGVMAELERIANHLGDIGAICNDASFSLIHAHCGILRERVLEICDRVFGHRLMMDRIMPGGVTHDIAADGAAMILAMLDEVGPQFDALVRLYDDTPSLQDRTCTTGIVGKDLVTRWAAGGHVGRASGRDFDTRRDIPYPPYEGIPLAIPVLEAGDVNARVWVRVREIEASIGLLRHWLRGLPDGPLRAVVPPVEAPREGVAMTEAFRGDVLIWLRLVNGRVSSSHARDASWFQWPLLEAAIEGNIVADFPLCNKSFNCSYSGQDI